MTHYFNTAGPCFEQWHYMVPPIPRAKEALPIIEQGQYFVLHAPRQSGKTTLLSALARHCNDTGRFAAVHFSCEGGQAAGGDFRIAEEMLISRIAEEAKGCLPDAQQPAEVPITAKPGDRLRVFLSHWARHSPLPLVLFFDEIDALVDQSLITVLRQLRAGYNGRNTAPFPHSIVLCGMRNVRDYKVASGGEEPRLGSASPFNISVKSIPMAAFSFEDVQLLYAQHTEETGQAFTSEATQKAKELSGGQPWLVNALANQVTQEMEIPLTQSILPEHIELAAQRIIRARQTHLDSLVARLHEPRVKRIMEPILAGTLGESDETYNDDVLYVRDLGLVAPEDPLCIANPIYQEVIVRVLAAGVASKIVFERPSFVDAQGKLDVEAILSEFSLFWKRHAAALLRGHVYHEVAAQIIFMAWLQRVVNGGGFVDREYGIGRGRIDILIRWPWPSQSKTHQWQQEAFELKAWAGGESDPLEEGLLQLEKYLDGLALTQGTLVIFDRRPEAKPSGERTSLSEITTPKGRKVRLLRA